MKIALFVHCFFPAHFYGTETYTLELARNLLLLGHQPVVVTAVFPGEPPQETFVNRYEHAGIPVVSVDKNQLPNTRVKDTYYQAEMGPVLDALLEEIAPDVVHITHLINHTAVLLEILARRGLPVVATFTDFFGFCYTNKLEAHDGSLCAGPGSPAVNCLTCRIKAGAAQSSEPYAAITRRPWGAALTARVLYSLQRLPIIDRGHIAGLVQDVLQRPRILTSLYQHIHHAVVPTSFIREAYTRNGFAGAMTRIPFGVDIDRTEKISPKGRPLVLGFVGQLMAHKGPDILIDAARFALQPGKYEIRLYGSEEQDPAYTASLKQKAAGLPVRFMGTFPAAGMRGVLDDMDVLVIPSRWYENSPLVLLNALASHTPVIISDVAGMTEFVQEGVQGYAFARGSSTALADVLRRIDGDRDALRMLSKSTRYDVTTLGMTEQTLEVYADAASRPRRGR